MAISIPGQPFRKLGKLLFEQALKATVGAVPLAGLGAGTTPINFGLPDMWNVLLNGILSYIISWIGIYILPANKSAE